MGPLGTSFWRRRTTTAADSPAQPIELHRVRNHHDRTGYNRSLTNLSPTRAADPSHTGPSSRSRMIRCIRSLTLAQGVSVNGDIWQRSRARPNIPSEERCSGRYWTYVCTGKVHGSWP